MISGEIYIFHEVVQMIGVVKNDPKSDLSKNKKISC